MSVWYCIPSARPLAEAALTLSRWREAGYKVALWRDLREDAAEAICDLLLVGNYPGYARAVNALAKEALALDPACAWIVTGGDDTEPHLGIPPEKIAAECSSHFGGSLGVMQPTGDRWANGSIDRIAGSPWIGREWCQRANRGAGPLWPEFTHMFVDECLQQSALAARVFWQRPELVHLHRHYMRASPELRSAVKRIEAPEHLRRWNTSEHWRESQAIFDQLRRLRFAPCLPGKATA